MLYIVPHTGTSARIVARWRVEVLGCRAVGFLGWALGEIRAYGFRGSQLSLSFYRDYMRTSFLIIIQASIGT